MSPATAATPRLFSLQPIGIGTASCESLLSYAMRLAEAHSIPTSSLFSNYIMPLTGIDFSRGVSGGFLSIISIIGLGKSSPANFISSLQALTRRSDLSKLSIARYHGLLSPSLFISRSRLMRWCPECIEEQNRSGIAYEPLMWSMEHISVCAIHKTEMLVGCESADCPGGRLISGTKIIGFCTGCHSWQGCRTGFKTGTYSQSFETRYWLSLQAAKLISEYPDVNSQNVNLTVAGINAIDLKFKGSITELYKAAGIQKSVVSYWRNGKSLPSFLALAGLCYAADFNIVDVLLGRTSEILASPSPREFCVFGERKSAARRRTNLHSLESALVKTIAAPNGEKTSVADISREIGVDSSIIRKLFPTLASTVSNRHLTFIKNRTLIRQKVSIELVKNAVNRIKSQGQLPTTRRVQEFLPPNILLRDKVLMKVYLECRSEEEES